MQIKRTFQWFPRVQGNPFSRKGAGLPWKSSTGNYPCRIAEAHLRWADTPVHSCLTQIPPPSSHQEKGCWEIRSRSVDDGSRSGQAARGAPLRPASHGLPTKGQAAGLWGQLFWGRHTLSWQRRGVPEKPLISGWVLRTPRSGTKNNLFLFLY